MPGQRDLRLDETVDLFEKQVSGAPRGLDTLRGAIAFDGRFALDSR
jgi:hypothetical protein